MAETRKTRVTQDWLNGGKWQPQYYDTSMQLWFDMGDPYATQAEAEAARTVWTTDTPAPAGSEIITAIAQQYDERVMAMLEWMRDQLATVGITSVAPFQMWDDNYRWSFTTHNADGEVGIGSADFTISIAEQHDYDGPDAPNGLNWGLEIVAYGGLILGGIAPHNYTEEVWVDSSDHLAVSTRYAELHDAIHDQDADSLAELVAKARADDE